MTKKGKGKAKQQTQRVTPLGLHDLYYGSYDANFNDQSDMGVNPSSSSDASFGIPVPSMQPNLHDNIIIPPNTNLNVGAVPNSNVPPYNPYSTAPNPYFAAPNPYLAAPNPNIVPLNPCTAHPDTNFASPNPNFVPLNPNPPAPSTAALNIVAPHPRLAHNTAALELMAETCRMPLFWRQRAPEGRTLVCSQPYDLMVCPRSSRNDNLQACQVEFKGEVLTGMSGVLGPHARVLLPRLTVGHSMSGSTGGASMAVPPTAGPSRWNTRRPAQPTDQSPGDAAASKNRGKARKSLRMVPVNLRNEVKHLVHAIALGSWGLSPGFDKQVQDIVAHQCALISALIRNYDHVDSAIAPFGHTSVTQMVQAICRQFRCHLPDNDDDINVNNIVAFTVTMLRFALREFSEGTYIPSEFVVEGEEAMYNEVLDRIKELDETDLEFYHLMIQHIFRLL
ncbi:hypothetical protein EV702DRAFT_1205545 [Suillus placidus]|uniref:DUF6532 domain-containing protein n=1 Tax=Suillus placidus TaxID=48579 RepID=A0A9P6ZFF4_9AGAM|nr:hypothetical protein EV702DRAFT_1205545 [Suillus placidus]